MSVEQLSRFQKFIDNKWHEYIKKAEA
jgi:hypothetical protein